ncbi:MAG: hypothetical protein WKF75_17990 [Singulisphaera sp.]
MELATGAEVRQAVALSLQHRQPDGHPGSPDRRPPHRRSRPAARSSRDCPAWA